MSGRKIIEGLNQAKSHAELEADNERLNDKVDGLESDLDSVLNVLIARINGQGDLASAAEWVRLNYPTKAPEGVPLERRK